MSKIITMTMIMTGLMLLFYFGGLLTECDEDGLCEATTANSALLNLLLKPERIEDSSWGIKTKLTVGSVTGILIIGAAILIPNIELAVMASFAIYFFTLLWDFLVVFQKVYDVTPVLAILFFAPLLFTFVIIIIDWWRGR